MALPLGQHVVKHNGGVILGRWPALVAFDELEGDLLVDRADMQRAPQLLDLGEPRGIDPFAGCREFIVAVRLLVFLDHPGDRSLDRDGIRARRVALLVELRQR